MVLKIKESETVSLQINFFDRSI